MEKPNLLKPPSETTRREFLKRTASHLTALALVQPAAAALNDPNAAESASLPVGNAPLALAFDHFPSPVHALIWRNWQLVSSARLAEVIQAPVKEVVRIARALGLSKNAVGKEQQSRSYLTIIRRNWHLLPYPQLLQLLGWDANKLAFTLREDDFLYLKLGNHKPKCKPIRYFPFSREILDREATLGKRIREHFPGGVDVMREKLFDFVADLSKPGSRSSKATVPPGAGLRLCYSYCALYGDPLLDPALNPFPSGYLQRLAECGVNAVWLPGLLSNLAPDPWDSSLSTHHQQRLDALRKLVARAKQFGMGVYLYLNEPRARSQSFFKTRPQLKGVSEGDHSALCTSEAAVQKFLKQGVEFICRNVPDLAGFFTITASENLTHCWSHGAGKNCPRCANRPAATVIAEVNRLVQEGISEAKAKSRLIAWDWGWADDWAVSAIEQLPVEAALMSVSEWGIPITRGKTSNVIGEYSMSVIGPGERAKRHWAAARKRGLAAIAKIQAGNTWELSAVPWIPVIHNVAEHGNNLRQAGVDGVMLGWTLGGYPSPNLEVVGRVMSNSKISAAESIEEVARRRYGEAAGVVIESWRKCSEVFRLFPFHGSVVYHAPMQFGPTNLLWLKPTGYRATMIGLPYDDLPQWLGNYPVETFVENIRTIGEVFQKAAQTMTDVSRSKIYRLSSIHKEAFMGEIRVTEAAAIHFLSTANQADFVDLRNQLKSTGISERQTLISKLKTLVADEMELAKRLHAIQTRDSRIGFESSNHYFYVPVDCGEKVLNCLSILKQLEAEQKT